MATPYRRNHTPAARSDVLALVRLVADGRPDIAVTCRDRTDGAGAQALGVISAMMLARFASCRYLHSPFTTMDHAIGTSENWAEQWERFLNLGDGETPAPTDAGFVPTSEFVRDPGAYDGRKVVVAERAFGVPPGPAAPIKEALREELRARYWRSSKAAIPSHRAADGITIAVHLRRGDVVELGRSHRIVSNAAALRQIVRVREALGTFGRPLTFNLYSEGTREEFRDLADAGCRLHISEDPFESFHNMVIADVLMTANSSFSTVASLLSRGLILQHNARSTRLSNHLRRRKNGDIPIRRVRRAILERMSWLDRCAYHVRRGGRFLATRSAG